MDSGKVRFQSYCWVLGTTSFRAAQMNLRIEEQLIHLRDFSAAHNKEWREWQWSGNPTLQEEFYYYLQDHEALTGKAKRPDKDARQRTSGLVTLGLINENREITAAGHELLDFVDEGSFDGDNHFMIPADSFIYFKQLLKAYLTVQDGSCVRPYLVLAHLLNKFRFLTYEEFTYLLPLIIDGQSLKIIEESIEELRIGNKTLDETIYMTLMAKQNYKDAFAVWMANSVDESLVKTIGMNRKSRAYDQKYYPLYQSLKKVFLEQQDEKGNVEELYRLIRKLPTKTLWQRLIFADSHPAAIKKDGIDSCSLQNPFKSVLSEIELKRQFFKYLHLFKVKTTLSDYFDLNRRYFKLTDTVMFSERKVEFDVIPRAFFSLIEQHIYGLLFSSSPLLEDSIPLIEISPIFKLSENRLLRALSAEFGFEITTLSRAQTVVTDERYKRLHELLDTRFTRDVVLELLDCFKCRNDERIQELVTEDATPSTIFEYILGLIWYEFSGRRGRVLDFMKLSFGADLMPRTHAQGGDADIIFEYDATPDYPKHDLLIEATLANSTNARRMEMEPVSRHLGTHVLMSGNLEDYCVFVAPEVDINVVNDFRSRRESGYWSDEGKRVTLKIIPIEIDQIKHLVEMGSEYSQLYGLFDKAFLAEANKPLQWKAEIAKLIGA